MNILYEFRCGTTYLAEVGCGRGERDRFAGTNLPADEARAVCCYVAQRCSRSTPAIVATDHTLARCTAFVEAHREGLRMVQAMYGSCGDSDDHLCAAAGHSDRAPCDATASLPDLDTLCPDAAPLTSTALLAAAFALPPLTRVELLRTARSMPDGVNMAGDADASTELEPYLFYCYTPYLTPAAGRDTHLMDYAEGLDEWRWLQSRFSTWYGFTSTLSCVLYDCASEARARFTLGQYMTRATTTCPGGTSGRSAESFVLMWGEEMLWRLLSALLSSLALLHSAGLTLHGRLQADDVVCFAVRAHTSARLQDAAAAVRGARFASRRDGGVASESERKEVERYMERAARDIVLPDAVVSSRTPCHRAFFVLTQLPALLMGHSGAAWDAGGGAANGDDFAAGARADVVAVGRLVRAVAAEQRCLAGDVERVVPVAPSEEFYVILERLTAASAETGGGPAQQPLSAAQLVRLQALRQRVSRWTYQSIAEDRQMLAHYCVSGEGKGCVGRRAAAVAAGVDDDVRALQARATLLAEREAKLDAFLQLYELTHEQLDSVPRFATTTPAGVRGAAALLQARLRQGVREATATAVAVPSPRQGPVAAAGAVRRRSPLLSPGRNEAEAGRVAASLHALATSVARDEAVVSREQTGVRRGSAQEIEVELSVEERTASDVHTWPSADCACAASTCVAIAAAACGGRDDQAAHPTLTLCPHDAATPSHHHHPRRSPRTRTDDGWFARQLGVLEEMRASFAQSAATTQRGSLSGRSSGNAGRASLWRLRDADGAEATGGDGAARRGLSSSAVAAPETWARPWDARLTRPSGGAAHGGATPASLGRTPRHDPRDCPAMTSATGRSPDVHHRSTEDEAARELLTRLRGSVALTPWPR